MSATAPEPIHVIGHRNPDTDAICSAIGYAAFLRDSRGDDAIPARCGDLSVRTTWVLQQAGLPAPKLLMDVRPTAATVCHRKVIAAQRGETFLSVYRKMIDHGFRSIPVVDDAGKIIGMPTLLDLAQLFMPATVNDADANRHVRTSEANMLAALDGTFPNGRGPTHAVENLILMVAGSSLETSQSRLRRFPHGTVVFLVGDRPDVQRMAIQNKARCLVVTGGFEVDEEIAALARTGKVPVIQTSYDTASSAQLVRFSRPIADAIHDDFTRFGSKTTLKEVIASVHDSNQPIFPVMDEENGSLLGVFSKSDLVDAPRTRLVLVDHNEFAQAVTGADEADIIEVIDHHRLSGNLRTKEPVRFINEPVGSTCTIVAMMYRLRTLKPDKATAMCLCAGMISDTLNLTSPTTTDTDREILTWLAELPGINVAVITTGFVAAGSMLKGKPAAEALESDRKEFDENGWRFSLSQIEELGLTEFWNQEGNLHVALEKIVVDRKLHFAGLLVTDITRHNSVFMLAGDPRVAGAMEYPEMKRGVFELKGVVSRKKQLLPYVCGLVDKMSPV